MHWKTALWSSKEAAKADLLYLLYRHCGTLYI
jgi:hypothetical protein